jgi:hypothetical protein
MNPSLAGLAGSTTTSARRPSGRITQGSQQAPAPETPPRPIAPVPVRPWQGAVAMRPRSADADRESLIQLTKPGEERPVLGSQEWLEQMKSNPIDISGVSKRPRPQTTTPGPGPATPSYNLSAKKPKISGLFYGIEIGQQLAHWGMRVASPSGAAPPPRSLRPETPSNLQNPIKNPSSSVQFAWSMIQKYVKQTDFRMENPLVSNEDIRRYQEFGAVKMVDALTLLARHMPGRYASAYLYMAEKGIALHLEGLEQIAAQYEDPMKNLQQLIKQWEEKFGTVHYWVRPGHPDYKAIDVSSRALKTALLGPNEGGWVSDSFIDAGIAAGRREVQVKCIVIESPKIHFWINQSEKEGEMVNFEGWGSVDDMSRRLVIFNDDLKGGGHHWLIFIADATTQSYSVINSMSAPSKTTTLALTYLVQWLGSKVFSISPRRVQLTSNPQQDSHSCGLWVIKNALAIINAETYEIARLQSALSAVTVDIEDRFTISRSIYQMINFEPRKSGDIDPPSVQSPKGLEGKQVDNFGKMLAELKK